MMSKGWEALCRLTFDLRSGGEGKYICIRVKWHPWFTPACRSFLPAMLGCYEMRDVGGFAIILLHLNSTVSGRERKNPSKLESQTVFTL